jgi:hypothetical protein
MLTGCSTHQAQQSGTAQTPPVESQSAVPAAKINISYSHPGDFLSSMVVTKYAGAHTLQNEPLKDGAQIIRFDGDVVVWQFSIEESMLGGLPLVGHSGTNRPAPKQVEYGILPQGFVQTVPDTGSPEPLEPDQYYVFMVTRGSASVSYEAVKVNGDGSLAAYAADPRAGTSFRLCCNIPPDFTISAPPP